MVGAGTTGDANRSPSACWSFIQSVCCGYNTARRPQGPQRPRLSHCHRYDNGPNFIGKEWGGHKNAARLSRLRLYWPQLGHILCPEWGAEANLGPAPRLPEARKALGSVRTYNDNGANLRDVPRPAGQVGSMQADCGRHTLAGRVTIRSRRPQPSDHSPHTDKDSYPPPQTPSDPDSTNLPIAAS